MKQQEKKKKLIVLKKPVVFRRRIEKTTVLPLTPKEAQTGKRLVMEGLALRASRTLSDQIKVERLYEHSLSAGKIDKEGIDMSKLNKKKNLNPEIRRMEANEPKPKELLTEKVRAKLNAPYKSPIQQAIKDAKKEV